MNNSGSNDEWLRRAIESLQGTNQPLKPVVPRPITPRRPAVTLADMLANYSNPQPKPLLKFKPAPQPPTVNLFRVTKPKVFISYHHKDQVYIDAFRKAFGGIYDVFTDCSLDEAIESTDLHYVNRTIREDFIKGSSITIVVCGTDTWRRKCVDWEIYSTLYKDHALLGIVLPHVQPVYKNGVNARLVPDRLFTNINSGYAHWIEWPQNPQELKQAISHAKLRRDQNKHLKFNSAPKMKRNV